MDFQSDISDVQPLLSSLNLSPMDSYALSPFGSDIKTFVVEATKTWHIQHEFSDCSFGTVCIWCNDNAGINFIQNHPPPGQTPGTRLEGSKNPPPGTIIVSPSGQNREWKAPPPGHKVRKFHKYIYKLWHYLKWKALWSQQIKQFFMRRLIIKIYTILQNKRMRRCGVTPHQ